MTAKRKAKQALEPEGSTRPSKRAAIAGFAALAGGAFLFWRRRSGNGKDAKP
jgi:MYXO-CTERM domain-containing protein